MHFFLIRHLISTIFFSGFVSFSRAIIQSTGSTVILNGVPYFAPPNPVTTLLGGWVPSFYGAGTGLLPMTVVTTNQPQYGASDLDTSVQGYAGDDVWQSGFLQRKYQLPGLYVTSKESHLQDASMGKACVLVLFKPIRISHHV